MEVFYGWPFHHRERHHGHHHHHKNIIPELVLCTFINKFKIRIMALSLVSNQKVSGVLGLVDQTNNNPVTAVFSGISASSDTPAAFAASVDGNGNIIVTGVAAGSGNLIVNATAAYTDTTGAAQSKALTATIPVVISAVIVADAVALVVTFGTPVAQ